MPSLTLKKLHSIAKEIILPVNYYTAGGGSGDDMKKRDEKKRKQRLIRVVLSMLLVINQFKCHLLQECG